MAVVLWWSLVYSLYAVKLSTHATNARVIGPKSIVSICTKSQLYFQWSDEIVIFLCLSSMQTHCMCKYRTKKQCKCKYLTMRTLLQNGKYTNKTENPMKKKEKKPLACSVLPAFSFLVPGSKRHPDEILSSVTKFWTYISVCRVPSRQMIMTVKSARSHCGRLCRIHSWWNEKPCMQLKESDKTQKVALTKPRGDGLMLKPQPRHNESREHYWTSLPMRYYQNGCQIQNGLSCPCFAVFFRR